jgi:thioredoxin 1
MSANEFAEAVTDASRPVLVEFWAEWCGPCRMMAPLLDEATRNHEGELTVTKVNVDEHPALARQYQVRSIPTMMIFRDGVPVATHVGSVSRSQLKGFIEAQLARQPA